MLGIARETKSEGRLERTSLGILSLGNVPVKEGMEPVAEDGESEMA